MKLVAYVRGRSRDPSNFRENSPVENLIFSKSGTKDFSMSIIIISAAGEIFVMNQLRESFEFS